MSPLQTRDTNTRTFISPDSGVCLVRTDRAVNSRPGEQSSTVKPSRAVKGTLGSHRQSPRSGVQPNRHHQGNSAVRAEMFVVSKVSPQIQKKTLK